MFSLAFSNLIKIAIFANDPHIKISPITLNLPFFPSGTLAYLYERQEGVSHTMLGEGHTKLKCQQVHLCETNKCDDAHSYTVIQMW